MKISFPKTALIAGVLVLPVACTQTGDKSAPVTFVERPHPLPPTQIQSPPQATPQNASLWTERPNALLSMRRAKEVGDILTVIVEMNDRANMQSSLSRSRDTSENLSIDALLGLPQAAGALLPDGAGVSPAIDFGRDSELNGSGAINRSERVTFRLAAKVIGVEPNGNLIIEGYQQTQVSNEVRYLTVSGVIRSQDITRMNTVQYDKISEASLAYVSTGEVSADVKRGGAAKLLDRVLPF
ncbi:MAG: flagellar basal body L-ring protein FlgH [Pseudomonadota bacterium]